MVLRLLVATALIATAAGGAPAGERTDPLRPALDHLARADTASAVHWLTRAHRRMDTPAGSILLARVYREQGTIAGRLRSQQVLEEARMRFPDDIDLRMELGRTYFAQGFFPDAVACFNDVLRADPSRCDARYLYGLYHFNNWMRVNDFRDNLRAARRELRAAVACDTTNADAAFKYLVACYALADTSLAESARMVRRFPQRGEFRLYRGALAYEAGRYEDCRRDFDAGIALLDEASRAGYLGVTRVLTGTEQMNLRAADPDSLARAYWVRRDLDPTTALNERELEHLYRAFLADALFSRAGTARPGWRTGVRGWETDRGEAFLKFGRPQSVSYSLGDDPTSGRLEIWSYVLDGVFFQFLFVDEFLNGNPRIPASAAIALHYLRESPRRTDFAPRVARIPGSLDVVAFRDDALTASVYLALHVDADSLRAAVDMAQVDHFNLRTAWFDETWRRRGATEIVLAAGDVPARRHAGNNRYELVRRNSVAFDRLNVACAFEDGAGDARALLVGETDTARFMAGGLVLSDILLTAESGPLGTVIVRRGGQMWARVDRTYRPGEALDAYVEIYNLARVAQSTGYDIRFAIHPAAADDTPAWVRWGRGLLARMGFGGEPVIAQTFHRIGSAHDDHESIRIDVSTLPPGSWELVIEVTDATSGQRAESRTRFLRAEADVAENE